MHATADEIKSAYKKLAMKYHPDRNQGSKFHEEHFKKILEAYQVLSDKYSRDMYDLRMFYDATKKSSTQASSSQTRPAPGPHGDIYGTSSRYARSHANQQRARAEQQAYATRPADSEAKPQPKWYKRAHYVVVLFWGVASVVMLLYWFYTSYQHANAVEFLRNGNYEAALEADPYFADAYVAGAKDFLVDQEPDYTGSIRFLTKAIKYQDVPDWQTYSLRADCYAKKGDYDLAVSDLEFAISLKQHEVDLNLRMAELYVFAIKQPQKAHPFLDTAILFAKPNSPELYKAIFAQGYGAMIEGDMPKALTALSKSAVLPQADAELFYLRGHVNHRLGNFAESCQDWNKAKTMGSEDAAIQFDVRHCAFVLLQQEQDLSKAGRK